MHEKPTNLKHSYVQYNSKTETHFVRNTYNMPQNRRSLSLPILIQHSGQLHNNKGVYSDCLKMITET